MQQRGDGHGEAALTGRRNVLPPAADRGGGTAAIHGAAGSANEATRVRRGWGWAVVAAYLAGAIELSWPLWADPAGRAPIGSSGNLSPDIENLAWFMRYGAAAVAHGHLPALVTTALNAPQGINLMWNPSLLLPSVALSPVTLLAGPHVSLTIMLTLGFAGSAAAMFLVLRRWGAGVGAAALGGAVYGFSPALRLGEVGHPHLQFAVLPPLIIDALLRIVTGRGSPLRTGAWLALLTAAQFFISQELLAETVLAAVVILAALAAGQPRAVPGRLGAAARGLGIAAGTALLICGYPLWVQFRGPLASHGSAWPPADFRNHPGDFVTAPSAMLLHGHIAAHALTAHPWGSGEDGAYLGWPLLLLLVAAAIWFWRDPRVRVMAVTLAVLQMFSLGVRTVAFPGFSYPAQLLPWHWVGVLPVLGDVLPNRFSILADGAAAAVLAFAVELALRAPPQGRRWWRPAVTAVAALAIVPLIPRPIQTGALPPVPSGWQTALATLRLPPMARVLDLPVLSAQAMEWQAQTGAPISLIGGYCIAPSRSGKAERCRSVSKSATAYLNSPPAGPLPAGPSARIKADLRYWRPAAVIAVTGRSSRMKVFLARLFGRPAVEVGRVVAWRLAAPPRRGRKSAAGSGSDTMSVRDSAARRAPGTADWHSARRRVSRQ